MTLPNIERNGEIYHRYKKGKEGYRKLGKIYRMHYTTIKEIVEREHSRELSTVKVAKKK